MPIQEISGSRDEDNALYIHDNQTNYPTVFIENKGSGSSLYVENKGPGNIAWFEGNKDSDGHGVVIENIGGDNNALNITNHQTNYPAVWIDNGGSGDSLYVGNTGTGSAIFCENSTNKETLYVEQKGPGSIARFIGNYTSAGVIIQNISGSHNALSIVNNIDTNSPAVCIENQGSGSSLYARNTGSGCIAYFEG
ncbi:MAG: hypothetical protein SWJ54_10900, partial [Cyanobacteriota bacterium]|nr:hypothetical protein [Cyanobacteriota bacterium]